MQQPLSHLYFVTVLRHLMSNEFSLTGLLKVAIAISEVSICTCILSII